MIRPATRGWGTLEVPVCVYTRYEKGLGALEP